VTRGAEIETLNRRAAECQDRDALIQIGGELQRIGAYSSAGRVLAKAGLAGKRYPVPEWDGSALDGRSLLVVRRTGHVGATIRLAHLVARVAPNTSRCTAVVDRRLLALLTRSFPAVTFTDSRPADWQSFDVLASYETLMQHLCSDDGGFRTFLPLRPDRELSLRLRERYCENGKPVVGISWHSTNDRKDLPNYAAWSKALLRADVSYVSLQYGDAETGIAGIAAAGGPPILYDRQIDAMNDIDGLAAQIAATDAVVTVSNTTAHLAGAIGHSTMVVIDSKAHLIWPYDGDRTPWYPELRLMRLCEGRDTLGEAVDEMRRTIG
jgi:hypothetical protein